MPIWLISYKDSSLLFHPSSLLCQGPQHLTLPSVLTDLYLSLLPPLHAPEPDQFSENATLHLTLVKDLILQNVIFAGFNYIICSLIYSFNKYLLNAHQTP